MFNIFLLINVQVVPENASQSGETILTLRGINLGSNPEDLEIKAVFTNPDVAAIDCAILPEGFQPSRQVACRLQSIRRGFTQLETPLNCRIALRLKTAQFEAGVFGFSCLAPPITTHAVFITVFFFFSGRISPLHLPLTGGG